MANKTAAGLVAYAKAQLGNPYWYGTFGQAASESLYNQKKKQYPKYYTWKYAGETGVKVHDCIGLVKGYLWCDSETDITPNYNAAQDQNANTMYGLCTPRGSIENIPDVPGVLVFMTDHVGVYIGGGYVVEARGHKYGVVKTKLSARPWTKWGYCPYVTYNEAETNTETSKDENTVNIELNVLKKGDEGEQVKALQRMLYSMGHLKGIRPVDGIFGSNTEAAVRAYKKKNGLTVNGIVDQNTWTKLLKG